MFRFAVRDTRRLTLWTLGIVPIVILLLLMYFSGKFQPVPVAPPPPQEVLHASSSPTYPDRTKPIFPPIEDAPESATEFCSNFPEEWLEKVQVVFKTGIGQSAKNAAHLASVTSCMKNMLVFSDFPEHMGGHDFIDILATLPKDYYDHPDLSAYFEQQKTRLGGAVGQSEGGWKLDRFKFLPMVNAAYKLRPGAEWYIFLEADVYMFWDNLFRYLDQFDSTEKHYFGSATPGSYGRWFAYGGAGILISRGLMLALVGDGENLSERYRQMVFDDCCGDAVLGYVIHDKVGVKLEDIYPMLSGDYLPDLGIDSKKWCTPLISLHRMSEDALIDLWKWERTRRPSETALVYADMIAYRQPFLQHTAYHDAWDNLSPDLLPSDNSGSLSLQRCAEACERDETCLQFSYTQNECRLGPNIIQGHEVVDKDIDFRSGWDRGKMRQLGLNFEDHMDSGCQQGQWTRAKIPWWGDFELAAAPQQFESKA